MKNIQLDYTNNIISKRYGAFTQTLTIGFTILAGIRIREILENCSFIS